MSQPAVIAYGQTARSRLGVAPAINVVRITPFYRGLQNPGFWGSAVSLQSNLPREQNITLCFERVDGNAKGVLELFFDNVQPRAALTRTINIQKDHLGPGAWKLTSVKIGECAYPVEGAPTIRPVVTRWNRATDFFGQPIDISRFVDRTASFFAARLQVAQAFSAARGETTSTLAGLFKAIRSHLPFLRKRSGPGATQG